MRLSIHHEAEKQRKRKILEKFALAALLQTRPTTATLTSSPPLLLIEHSRSTLNLRRLQCTFTRPSMHHEAEKQRKRKILENFAPAALLHTRSTTATPTSSPPLLEHSRSILNLQRLQCTFMRPCRERRRRAVVCLRLEIEGRS